MADSAVLEMLNATPQEQAALRQIAMLRQQGIPDDQIFQGVADPSFTQAGGYGFLPYITDMAGITSSYNLGRGNIALNAADAEYQRQGNPYNVVTALQNMRDTNNTAVLSDPTLQNVQQGPASLYSSYISSLFGDKGAQTAATTGQPASAQTPVAMNNEVQRVRNEVGDQQAQQGFQNFANFDAARQPGITPPNVGVQPTNAETGAQSAAARLVGGSIKAGTIPQFTDPLNAGQIPGFSSINERDANMLLSDDQKASWMGLVGSTGRVSNPMQAYNSFLSKYSMGGSQGARSYR